MSIIFIHKYTSKLYKMTPTGTMQHVHVQYIVIVIVCNAPGVNKP